MKYLFGLLLFLGILFFPRQADASFSYQYVGQSAPQTVSPGESKPQSLTIKNTGTDPWNFGGPNPVRLGTSHPQDRGSAFYNASWLSPSRIAMTRNVTDPGNTTNVLPGQTAIFEWTISPNWTGDDMGGTYPEWYQPVVEGVTWMPDSGIWFPSTVPAKIGVNLFLWYKPGSRWNGAVDVPNGGQYNSGDPAVLRRQFQEMVDAGIGFVNLDWWEQDIPRMNPGEQRQNVETAINIIHEFPSLKYTILVEPVVTNAITPVPQYVYDGLWAAHASSDPQYLKYHGKPLITCYLYRTCYPSDPRFSSLQFTGSTGLSWPTLMLWHYPIEDVQNDVSSLFSRFDNFYCIQSGECGNAPLIRYNVSLQESVAQNQLNYIGATKNTQRLVFYYGWNEYYERANIEPHTNPDYPGVSTTYSYDLLKNFILNTWKQ